MGSDKALVAVDGVPMVSRIAETLRAAACDPVIAVGGNSTALAELGLVTIADRWPGEGPLGGVITALDHFQKHDAVVVVACDLPRLMPSVVTALLEALGESSQSADVARALTDRPQPLCAVWRPRAAAQLLAEFESGGRRLLDALSELRVVEVVVDPQQLVNVNTVADLP
jgi:molybdopterin-guanine dinucleotide biosynthesis protein A